MSPGKKIDLTSAEVASLWTAYIAETMSICILKYFLKIVEDKEIKPVIEYGLQAATDFSERIEKILKSEKFPLPHGFSNQDVNLEAPRLFTDVVLINFMKSMAKTGLGTYALAFSLASRDDIRALYKHFIDTTIKMDEKSVKVLINKGLYVRPPYITYPEEVTYVQEDSFLAGFITTNSRALSAQEITHLFTSLDTNALGHILMIGFSQVADAKNIRKLMWEGKDIAAEHKKAFSKKLVENDLPTPSLWDSGVTSSTKAPFSDKLMTFMVAFLSASGVGNYGMAMAASPRHDIALMYAKLSAEIGKYADEIARVLIDNGWMEEPPQSVDRERLVKL